MRPFNLNEYLNNPSLKVVTRLGNPARIISTDFHSSNTDKCIIALITINDYGHEIPTTYFNNGRVFMTSSCSEDLFFAEDSTIHVGYVNMELHPKGFCMCKEIYDTKQEAIAARGESFYYTTLKIEWE